MILCSCGFQNPDTSRFCAQCGRPFPGSGTGRLPPQATLAGRYIIAKLLGQGGMGAVYLASDLRIAGKTWAVKEMSDAGLLDLAEKAAATHAFQAEATLLAALDHPNIPKVVDYFDEAGKHYLVMEYVPGETLESAMHSRGAPFSEAQVVRWGAQTVRWLRANNAYWVITRYGRRNDTWEIVTPTWVRLRAWRDEKGELFKDGVFDAKSSYDETYEAQYVVQKIDGQWYVTCKGAVEAGKAPPCSLTPP